jgi:hypothetical protein
MLRQLDVDLIRWSEFERRLADLSADELGEIAAPLADKAAALSLKARALAAVMKARKEYPA